MSFVLRPFLLQCHPLRHDNVSLFDDQIQPEHGGAGRGSFLQYDALIESD